MDMKKFFVIVFLFFQVQSYAQNNFLYEKPPVFSECDSVEVELLQKCFDNQVFAHVFNNFKVPQEVMDTNYNGDVVILFEVDKEGQFRVIYVDATYQELKDEAKRVFGEFPKIKPGTYNGKPTYKQYSIAVKIPLVNQAVATKDLSKEEDSSINDELTELEKAAKTEYDSVNKKLVPFSNKEYTSQLNIPFTHSNYAKFDRSINLVGTN
ncbi:MAG TPA: gliding motility protein RemB, partial [Xanthomarina gelatinilytica]|nr:gliding motility protein RemB [Xanthomarina gelatinilytica]